MTDLNIANDSITCATVWPIRAWDTFQNQFPFCLCIKGSTKTKWKAQRFCKLNCKTDLKMQRVLKTIKIEKVIPFLIYEMKKRFCVRFWFEKLSLQKEMQILFTSVCECIFKSRYCSTNQQIIHFLFYCAFHLGELHRFCNTLKKSI